MKTIKNIHNKTYGSLCALALLCVFCVSCTDTWNEHYDVVEGGMADQPTLLENIQADASLANFYKVITAIGGAETFNSPQQLTVWAPRNLTSAQVDSVIAVYQADVAAGLKWEDNRAITQFLQNHVALYARPVSSLTNDTISMLNKKYMHLLGKTATSGTLNENPFDGAVVCSNGILYKTNHIQTFFPNVREYIEQTVGMDSLIAMIKTFDEYELDEGASVPGGVVDGKTVYLDSVTNLSNDLLTGYRAYIQREDSVYWLVAPTNDVWKELYNKYKAYYNYDPTVNNADSLSDIMAKYQIVRGRFMNVSEENKYNRHPEDSLVNTVYMERQSHNPRSNVYYNPFAADGILNGLEMAECSNGRVYVDNKGVIDPHSTFFGRMDYNASYSNYYEVDKKNNEETMNVVSRKYNVYDSDTTDNIVKTYDFVEVTAKVSGEPTVITYTLPSTLSGAYYNIYVVTTPASSRSAAKLPCWFQVSHSERNERGTFPSAQSYTNPFPITAESDVDNADVILKQSSNNRCYVASAEKVDTILIQSAVQYTYAGAGIEDGVVKLTIRSFGPSSGTYREKIYTRTLRLNEIILVPFETEEEAKAAALDKDAFNDELLEANKEN